MTSLNAVIAANRFGMGARPGDLGRIGGDPRSWLLSSAAWTRSNASRTAVVVVTEFWPHGCSQWFPWN